MRRRSIAVLAFHAALVLGVALATAGQDSLRLDGEYALNVMRDGDTVRVRWITRRPAAGSLQVVAGNRVRHDLTTPAGTVHSAHFTHRGGGAVLLRYGAKDDPGDRHETSILLDTPRRPRVAWSGVDSLYVISDVHGEFDTLTAVLRNAGIIDKSNAWSARRAHLAIAGDMTDRGPDVTRVLWFLYRLEKQAERAGGRVHVVLGNHEIMVMLADLRYVHAKEQSIAQAYGIGYDRLFDPRRSILGTWLASKPALIRIGDALIAHGGVSTDFLPYTLESFDDTLETYVGEQLFYFWADTTVAIKMDSATYARREEFFWGPGSVLWFRGYAQTDTLQNGLGAVLRRFGAGMHVIGHTPGTTIREGYGGSVIVVNTVPFAAELLLLTRERGGHGRFRIRTTGPPARL